MSTAVWILQIYNKINDVKSLLLSLYRKHVCTKLHHNVCHSLLPYRSRRLEQLLKLLPIWLVLHSDTYSLSLQNFLSHTLFHIQTCTKTEDNPLSNSLQYKSVSHIYICPFWYTNSGWPSPHMTNCLQMPSHMDSLSFSTHSALYNAHLPHFPSHILSSPSINVTFLFSSPQTHHHFISAHQFCSKLLGFHEPWAYIHKSTHYLKYSLPFWP